MFSILWYVFKVWPISISYTKSEKNSDVLKTFYIVKTSNYLRIVYSCEIARGPTRQCNFLTSNIPLLIIAYLPRREHQIDLQPQLLTRGPSSLDLAYVFLTGSPQAVCCSKLTFTLAITPLENFRGRSISSVEHLFN